MVIIVFGEGVETAYRNFLISVAMRKLEEGSKDRINQLIVFLCFIFLRSFCKVLQLLDQHLTDDLFHLFLYLLFSLLGITIVHKLSSASVQLFE